MSVNWSEVYRATYREVLRYLHRRVWDLERARELAQETFVRALDQSPDNPRALVFRIAANLARDEARMVIRRKKHLALLKVEAESGRGSIGPETAETEARDRREALRLALAALSDSDREVLLLWDAGLSYREIAERTGLAPGSIGTTLARARKRLVDAYTALEARNVARG